MTNAAGQFLRFCVIGVASTVTHFLVAVIMVEFAGLPVLWANAVAFAIAFLVSYSGNHRWTFALDGGHGRFLPRFVATQLAGFGLNQAIVWLIAIRLGADYRLGLAAALVIVPVVTFLISRLWAFSPAAEPGRKAV